METKNSTYLILTMILLILSAIGGYFLFQTYQGQKTLTYNSDTVPKIELVPTDTIDIETPISSTSGESAKTTITPTKKVTPTKIITPTKVITPTKIITKTPTAVPTVAVATPAYLDYSNSADGFSVAYSSKRKVYEDTESSGNRYTFYSTSGNFAIHVSSSDKWSWTHPDRQFSSDFTVSGQPTFRYDISSQTIVDLQSSDKNYTLQCVHNGNTTLKAECEDFLASFKLL